MGVYTTDMTLRDKIEHLRLTGYSLTMSWAEDTTPMWDVAWVTSGEGFSGVHADLEQALDLAHAAGIEHFHVDTPD